MNDQTISSSLEKKILQLLLNDKQLLPTLRSSSQLDVSSIFKEVDDHAHLEVTKTNECESSNINSNYPAVYVQRLLRASKSHRCHYNFSYKDSENDNDRRCGL